MLLQIPAEISRDAIRYVEQQLRKIADRIATVAGQPLVQELPVLVTARSVTVASIVQSFPLYIVTVRCHRWTLLHLSLATDFQQPRNLETTCLRAAM